MHELSIASSLLDLVDEHARREHAARVLRVRIQVGEVAGVELDLLRRAFELAREGTPCREAELEIELMPARWECRKCGGAIVPEEGLSCASCGAPAVLTGGAELVLERIEMEVE